MPPVASTTAFARKRRKRPRSRSYANAPATRSPSLSRVSTVHSMCTSMPLMDCMILERTDHLEARAVAHVREARILVAAEVALKDPAVGGAVEQRAPRLELAHASRRLLRVQLGHPPVVEVLAAAHGVAEVHLQLSRSSTLPEDAAMPPSAITVCALPSSDLQTTPTDIVALRRQRRSLRASPAPPAPITSTSCVTVSYSAMRRSRLVHRIRQSCTDAHRAQTNVEVGERDAEEAHPRPLACASD